MRFFEHPGKVAGAGIMVPSERHENLALATTVVVRRRSAARIFTGVRVLVEEVLDVLDLNISYNI